MKKSILDKYKKVIYICKTHKETGLQLYYRQEYLLEDIRWGEPRPVSKATFIRRVAEGYTTQYEEMKRLPDYIIQQLNEINNMIDLALDTKDKVWFDELIAKRKQILEPK